MSGAGPHDMAPTSATDASQVEATAEVVSQLRALGLAPPPVDLALALPAILQIETMAREIHQRLARAR